MYDLLYIYIYIYNTHTRMQYTMHRSLHTNGWNNTHSARIIYSHILLYTYLGASLYTRAIYNTYDSYIHGMVLYYNLRMYYNNTRAILSGAQDGPNITLYILPIYVGRYTIMAIRIFANPLSPWVSQVVDART